MPPGAKREPVIRPLVLEDIPPLALGLASLPLLARYGRTPASLAASLALARERGDGLLVATEGGV